VQLEGSSGATRTRSLAISIAFALAIVGAAVTSVAAVDLGPRPPFLDPAAAPVRSSPERSRSGLVLAGSGSNLPLTRELAAAYAGRGHAPPLIHTSIGSGGGIRALRDGAIDLALVSRPLKEEELARGLVAFPYARAPVMFAVHASVPDVDVTPEELVQIFAGERTSWSDGSKIVVLQREQGDSSHAAVAAFVPGFEAANEVAYRSRSWRVLYTDNAMDEALASTPGAIGLRGSGPIPPELPVRALAVDGVAPSSASIERGSYLFYKDFAFVARGATVGEEAAFIEFARSPEGRAIVAAMGCIPLGGREETP